METPNADYNALMDKKGGLTFPQRYDAILERMATELKVRPSVRIQLRAKRDFGLQKYGERAFQSNFENAITSPVGAHLGDELVDAYNYALHGLWAANTNGQLEKASACRTIIKNLNALIRSLTTLKYTLDPEEQDALAWVGSGDTE